MCIRKGIVIELDRVYRVMFSFVNRGIYFFIYKIRVYLNIDIGWLVCILVFVWILYWECNLVLFFV